MCMSGLPEGACSACEGQERALATLELQLEVVVSGHMGAGT